MNNAVVVPKITSNSVVMVPVKPPQTRLVTGQTKEIYVPLASKYNFGIVKIGDGLLISDGVVSFDNAKIEIMSISKNGKIIQPDANRNVNIELDKNDVGLGFVDNVADIDKPISILQYAEFEKKLNIQQKIEDANKFLYINNEGKIDFKHVDTKIRVDDANGIVSDEVNTFKFSNNFNVSGGKVISIDISSALKQSISKLDSDLSNAFVGVSLNSSNGTFTFVKRDGSKVTLDTLLEKVVTNFIYDENSQELVLSLEDGTQQRIPMTAFIDDYLGVDGDVISVYITNDNKIGAILKNGVIDEAKLSLALSSKIASLITEEKVASNYLSFTDVEQQLTKEQQELIRNKIGAGAFDDVVYVEKPTLTTNQQVVTVKSNGDTEGIALASNSNAAIFGTIPRYQNPAYDDADTPPSNMGNLVAADPTKPLHVVNKRFLDENFLAKNTTNDGLFRAYVKEGNGTNTLRTIQTIPQVATIPLRSADGNVRTNTPVDGLDSANKNYVDDKFIAKQTPEFDAGATRGYVYYIERQLNPETGEYETVQTVKKVQIQANPDTVVLRNPSGNFYVSAPTLPYECTNKQYVDDKFNGASKPETYDTYLDMINKLNGMNGTEFNRGQDIMIVQTGIPDVWVAYIENTSVQYTYVDDDTFVNELLSNGTVQVGYYKLGYLETQKFDPSGFVKKTDYASSENAGIVKINHYSGIRINANYELFLDNASADEIKNKSSYNALKVDQIDKGVQSGLAYSKLEWSEEEKASARTLLGIEFPQILILEDE